MGGADPDRLHHAHQAGMDRRNGIPHSDQATMTEHFIATATYLTHVTILTDPVYLTEPLIKSRRL